MLLLGTYGNRSAWRSFACATGQAEGDKKQRGDLRTPEGIYFISETISKQLDFREYGGIAYSLNYPNPIDILHGKTGDGIWIHSRGRSIMPRETRGCIAINLEDIERLQPYLVPGTAIVLANRFNPEKPGSPAEDELCSLVEEKTRQWNNLLAERSPELFTMYNPEAYSTAQQEPFADFQKRQSEIFARQPWCDVLYRDIYVLQGPDYWVSWFEQYIHDPAESQQGTRRLYWQRDSTGELRISGMEWLPQELGFEAVYDDLIVTRVSAYIEAWRKAWESAALQPYAAFYAANARQSNLEGQQAIQQAKARLWRRVRPVNIKLSNMLVIRQPYGVRVEMDQEYRDSTGHTDLGTKVLILQPKDDSWEITEETWTAYNP